MKRALVEIFYTQIRYIGRCRSVDKLLILFSNLHKTIFWLRYFSIRSRAGIVWLMYLEQRQHTIKRCKLLKKFTSWTEMPPTSLHASASKRPRIPQYKARKARVINNPEMIARHLPRKNSYLTSKLLRGTPAPAPTDRPSPPPPKTRRWTRN